MGYWYFDESIQQRAGFIAGAWIHTAGDITPQVYAALAKAGLSPGKDEFKSGARMISDPRQSLARDLLHEVLSDRSVGFVVAPVSDRPRLGSAALTALSTFIRSNASLAGPHVAFLDEGIGISNTMIQEFTSSVEEHCEIRAEQDSRSVAGIQLADLASHSAGIMLLEHMGQLRKLVGVGKDSGYHPDSEIQLGFEMFSTLRHKILKAPMPIPKGEDELGDLIYMVEGYGLHIATNCDEQLRKAARERFGTCYMGCLH